MQTITSRSNPRIKALRALCQRKGRAITAAFLVEGIHAVGQAVAAQAHIDSIYYAPDLLTSEFALRLVREQTERGLPCFPVAADVFTSISEKDNPQGILALLHKRSFALAELSPSNFPWGVALLSPQDPGNVGTILRTLDAVGASGLLLLEQSVDETHPSSVRASMGALFWYPVVRASFSEFIAWARQHDYTLYGTSARAAQDFTEIPRYTPPLILLMGSEREGLEEEHRRACTHLLRLPMHGKVTSLNLAVATGVLLYDILRKLQIPSPAR